MKSESCLKYSKTGNPPRHKISRDVVFLIGDLLPIFDFVGVLAAACAATAIYLGIFEVVVPYDRIWHDSLHAAIGVAVLAPLILYDRRFVTYASGSLTRSMVWCFAVRVVLLMIVIVLAGMAHRYLHVMPLNWILMWIGLAVLATGMTRIVLVHNLRRLERAGVLSESIAIVGRGDIADRLISTLLKTRGASVDIVGVFDDDLSRRGPTDNVPAGSVDDLIELGKLQELDWIVFTIPATAHDRLPSLINRLKALSVPLGLCPQSFHVWEPQRLALKAVVQPSPRFLLPSTTTTLFAMLPRWTVNMLGLPLLAYRRLRAGVRGLLRYRRRRAR